MPQYKTHLIGGAVTFFTIYLFQTKILEYKPYNIKVTGFTFLLCLLGSIYPDIDTKSVAQKLFYMTMAIALGIILLFAQWQIFTGLTMASFLPLLVRHRGLTHAISFVILTPFLIYLLICQTNPNLQTIAWPAFYYFTAGGLSHLILDFGFTKFLRRGFF